MKNIIRLDKSIIPACDVSTLDELRNLVKQTCHVEGIGGYKIGFELVIPFGMKQTIDAIRQSSDLPIIYDHQKAATDVPFTGEKFAKACREVDAVILFPQAGPVTEEAWIKAVRAENMGVIVGGEMTHPGYLEDDNGFMKNDAPTRMYTIAANLGVKDFVVPGNKSDRIRQYRELLEAMNIAPVFYSPGLVEQGGRISEAGKSAGQHWHAIVGRGLYQAKDITAAAKELTRELK